MAPDDNLNPDLFDEEFEEDFEDYEFDEEDFDDIDAILAEDYPAEEEQA
jgi:hypothetical protein